VARGFFVVRPSTAKKKLQKTVTDDGRLRASLREHDPRLFEIAPGREIFEAFEREEKERRFLR